MGRLARLSCRVADARPDSFALASDLGATPIQVEFLHGSQLVNGAYPYRQVWYARYIE